MSLIKDLTKEKKQIDVQIRKLIKTRLNDRTSDSWVSLRALKKKKLAPKFIIFQSPYIHTLNIKDSAIIIYQILKWSDSLVILVHA